MASENKKIEKMNSENTFNEVLQLMEKIVDDKISSLRTFVPLLLAVITSVIAFLMVYEVDITTYQGKFISLICAVALVLFITLINWLMGKISYKAKVRKIKSEFDPVSLQTYCYLSDEDFLEQMKVYVSRDLSEIEILKAKYLKQKVNEYISKKGTIETVYIIVGAVVILMALGCFVLYFGLTKG